MRRLQVGTLVCGRYELQHELGFGGLGVVWAARHTRLEESVALKFLRPEFIEDADAVSRFTSEARACFVLRSEHVVRVLDVDKFETIPFFVMEMLDGTDLRRVLDRGLPLSAAVTVDYGLQICEALSAAHASGIVHRDVKPENLFLLGGTDGSATVKVLDFGISKVTAEWERRQTNRDTRTRVAVGTPPYMSPEQVRAAQELDARSDIWSLGCVLYELLAGTGPFDCGSPMECCAAVLEHEPPSLAELRPELPAGLSDVIARCLRKDPDQRFAHAADLAAALAPFGSGCFDDYAARCRAQLTGERRSSPELSAFRDSIPTAELVAARARTATLQDAGSAIRMLLQFLYAWLRLQLARRPVIGAVVLAAVPLLVVGMLWWLARGVDASEGVTQHIVLPSQPTQREASGLELAPAASNDRRDAAIELGRAEPEDSEVPDAPKVTEPTAAKRHPRRNGLRAGQSRSRTRHEPDVGF